MSVLRYPGGKQKAIKILSTFLPAGIKEICAPFVGGGSFELFCCSTLNIKVYAYDNFEPLINFWKCLKANAKELITSVRTNLPMTKEKFYEMRNHVEKKDLEETESTAIIRASNFFCINRCSFSGTTLSGGYSKESALKRFTISSIEKLCSLHLENITFECKDFEESVKAHPGMFLFMDPPYALEKQKNNLYGTKGNKHKGFDHERLHRILIEGGSNWMMCYNDCETIQNLYSSDAYARNNCITIHSVSWSYSMSKNKKSNEVVIVKQKQLEVETNHKRKIEEISE